ncbi:hypothetical protein CEY12_08150 [Chryseobacterium sp. T16E-39]|uniref:hypothetical protein n=1 Tax=Chryseobacterium sp. T16E-39 TaxID=2015076 RepID=UPI000B5B18CA|nr:hypothetical protein [Chryseobacterium sp. T16E-39]ASK30086.1 hypothetical protein CEY12_08150 [Chryseobacterium sp. T16E-39]
MKPSKAIITLLVLIFSLSPCSVKRDLLDIFDIQYISPLNKFKTTPNPSFSCDSSAEISSGKIVHSKKQSRSEKDFPFRSDSGLCFSAERKNIYTNFSGTASGNSPPKYILFKQLKLNVI